MLLLLNRLSCFLLLCVFLNNSVYAQTILPKINKVGQHSSATKKYNLQALKAKEEHDKKKAIAEMKLKTGCIKPDVKKIAAIKEAQLKYKNKP